jgi:hypothetical protein
LLDPSHPFLAATLTQQKKEALQTGLLVEYFIDEILIGDRD